jgi:osmotically-inducible protein OsmY
MELFDNTSTDPENDGSDRSDAEVRQDIVELFSRNEYLRDRNIQVQVKDCVVTLEGIVQSRQSWDLAADLAAGVRGVSEIKNQIHIQDNIR